MRAYRVHWTSVDGAGTYAPAYRDRNAAVYLADSRARAANADVRCGVRNPWGYAFVVRDERGAKVYEAPFVHGSLERLAQREGGSKRA